MPISCWVGSSAFEHPSSDRLFTHPGHETLDRGQADVRLQQGLLDQAKPIAIFDSVSFPRPRSVLIAAIRLSWRDSTWLGGREMPAGVGNLGRNASTIYPQRGSVNESVLGHN